MRRPSGERIRAGAGASWGIWGWLGGSGFEPPAPASEHGGPVSSEHGFLRFWVGGARWFRHGVPRVSGRCVFRWTSGHCVKKRRYIPERVKAPLALPRPQRRFGRKARVLELPSGHSGFLKPPPFTAISAREPNHCVTSPACFVQGFYSSMVLAGCHRSSGRGTNFRSIGLGRGGVIAYGGDNIDQGNVGTA